MSDVADWWKTSIIDMEPGRIELRGHPIQDLIGHIAQTIIPPCLGTAGTVKGIARTDRIFAIRQ